MDRILIWIGAVLSVIVALILSFVENIVDLLIPRYVKRKDVSGKIVLITGSGSGVGRGVAIRLARKGARLVLWDVNSIGNEETKRMIEEFGGVCKAFTIDLCDRPAIYKLAEEVKKEFGKVDILYNNAGIVTGKDLLQCSEESIQRTFDVNVLSYIATTKAFLPDMIKDNSGQIVNIGSLASFAGGRKLVDYCSSKFATFGFHESLQDELMANGYDGIHLTFIAPFMINTGMFSGASSGIIDPLTPDYVSDEVADAILMRSEHVFLPWFSYYLIAIRRFFTTSNLNMVNKSFGISTFMDDFKGRKTTEIKEDFKNGFRATLNGTIGS